ncbi:hypothetical protein Forpi1262_v018320 [Fusarium oxysporum f. sp. raphani]|uniref:Cyanovirin-N domain-containing protein n=1 Tax=Fusarium oxysporum f. sp. raphani TaxID=96318 RepID=A0A8J5NS57_FUSOX|nr:hypothetical protein Forpi1262_v018320 [Fusarium oxysporum f. sp. raphani]
MHIEYQPTTLLHFLFHTQRNHSVADIMFLPLKIALAILALGAARPSYALHCRRINFAFEGVMQSASSCAETCYRNAQTARTTLVGDPDPCQAMDPLSAVGVLSEDLGTCENCGTAFLSCKCGYEVTMWRAHKENQVEDGTTYNCSPWEIAKRMSIKPANTRLSDGTSQTIMYTVTVSDLLCPGRSMR